jgi:hypothetical protein
MKRALALVLCLLAQAPLAAQEAPAPTPPPGPAPAPVIADDTAPPPEDSAHAGVRRAMGQGAPIADARPSNEVPRGTVRVRVLRPDGSPIERAAVRLGVMAQSGDRTAVRKTTDAQGIALFQNLATGQGQAYRPRVVSGGATYAATPFQLDPDRGQDVTLRVFPTTPDIDSLLLMRGQAIIELRPERMHVTMQLDVANVTEETFVFPSTGLALPLPPNATAFQAQESMNDQRLTAENGVLRMRGSITPGRTQLVYGYDLPYEGKTLDVSLPNPFRTMSFGVAVEATQGLTLEVADFPPSERRELADGRAFILTQLDRAPTDPPLRNVQITITGIPGKGPWAYIAAASAALVFSLCTAAARRGKRDGSGLAAARKARKEELVAEARALLRDRKAGEVGPAHYAKTRDALVTELAALLSAESR